MKKVKVGSKPPFVQNLLLVEGITRAGKFLLANLLTAIRDIEPMQYKNNLEIIPYLLANGLIDKAVAQELIRCEVDINSYEMLIGRNFNLRKSDKSSIFNHPSSNHYLHRSDVENQKDLLLKSQKKNPYFLYILHESLPNIQLLFDIFPDLRLISLRRDPVELVYSWYQRGHGSRWGSDPILFQIPFYHKKGPIPWFAIDWADDYHHMSEMDRVIKSILFLW